MKAFHCDYCKRNLHHDSDFTTGYGRDYDTGDIICFQCCGEQDKDTMAECKPGDKFTLYLTLYNGWSKDRKLVDFPKVSNWPGTLKFRVQSWVTGRHNWGLNRYDVWFKDHTGAWWWGVQYGDNTQIVHCKKLKHPVY